MLGIQFIKATDVTHQRRRRKEYLQTQNNAFSKTSTNLKNSLSEPVFEKDIGFVANSTDLSKPLKSYVPDKTNDKISMALKRRRPIQDLTPITKAMLGKIENIKRHKNLYNYEKIKSK